MEASFIINEEIRKRPIIIYGTEVMGKACLNEFLNNGVDVEGFCSTDTQKCGTLIQGKKVISPEELLAKEKCNVVITVEDYEAVASKLEDKSTHSTFIYRDVYKIHLL